MKIFTIPGLDTNFYQHDYSQSISSDTNALYEKIKENLLTNTKDFKILDFGTGNGILLIMLAKDFPYFSYIGIEIFPDLVEIANQNFMSLEKNLQLSIDYEIIEADYSMLCAVLNTKQKYDLIISNPPYYPPNSGKQSIDLHKAASRFEIYANLYDLLSSIKNYLANTGKAYVIFPASRKEEFVTHCNRLCLDTTYHYNTSDYTSEKKMKIIFELKHADIS